MKSICGVCDCWSSEGLQHLRDHDTRWFGKREVPNGLSYGRCSQAGQAVLVRHSEAPACPLFVPARRLDAVLLAAEAVFLPRRALRRSDAATQKLLDSLARAADNESVLASGLKSCHQAMVALFVETRDSVRPRNVTADEAVERQPNLADAPEVKLPAAQFQASCFTAFNTGYSRMAQRAYASIGHVLGRLNTCRVEPVVAALLPEVDTGRPGVMHQPPEELEKEGL